MAEELTGRLSALGRAHDLVRPISGKEGKAALFGDLIAILLAPYDDMGAFSGRVRVSVPRMGVGEKAATTLALITLVWTERGGPAVAAPQASGYGSKLIGRVIAAELDGTIDRQWSPDGAVITVRVRKDRLSL